MQKPQKPKLPTESQNSQSKKSKPPLPRQEEPMESASASGDGASSLGSQTVPFDLDRLLNQTFTPVDFGLSTQETQDQIASQSVELKPEFTYSDVAEPIGFGFDKLNELFQSQEAEIKSSEPFQKIEAITQELKPLKQQIESIPKVVETQEEADAANQKVNKYNELLASLNDAQKELKGVDTEYSKSKDDILRGIANQLVLIHPDKEFLIETEDGLKPSAEMLKTLSEENKKLLEAAEYKTQTAEYTGNSIIDTPLAGFNKMFYETVKLPFQVASFAGELFNEMADLPSGQRNRVYDFLETQNQIASKVQQDAKRANLTQEQIDKGFFQNAQEGDLKAAALNLTYDVLGTLPQVAVAAYSPNVAVNSAGKLAINYSSKAAPVNLAASKMFDDGLNLGILAMTNQKGQEEYNKAIEDGLTPTQALAISTVKSLATVVSESLFMSDVKALAPSVRKQLSKELLENKTKAVKDIVQKLPKEFLEQGSEESFEELFEGVVDGMVDYIATGKPINPYELADQAVVGLTSGGATSVKPSISQLSSVIRTNSGVLDAQKKLNSINLFLQNNPDLPPNQVAILEEEKLRVIDSINKKGKEIDDKTQGLSQENKDKYVALSEELANITDEISNMDDSPAKQALTERAKSVLNERQELLESATEQTPQTGEVVESEQEVVEEEQVTEIQQDTDAVQIEETGEVDVQEQAPTSQEMEGEVREQEQVQEEVEPSATSEVDVNFQIEQKLSPKAKAKAFINKWFGSQRTKKKEEIYQLDKDRQGEIASQLKVVENTSKDLRRVSKEEGVSTEQTDQALRGEIPIAELPTKTATVVQDMRNQVDNLSKKAISLGIVPDELIPVYEGNLGTYLTRSYRAYDDVNWPKKIPQEVKNKAFSFLKDQYREEVTNEFLKENPNASKNDIETALNNRVVNKVQELLDKDKSFVAASSNIASKDLSVLKRRKEIPPEIRALLGEYTDPIQNYAKSVFKMANFVANGKFLNDLKEKGLGNFLFEKTDPNRPSGYSKMIAAEGSETLSPLNGLYTTPEIAEQLKETTEVVPMWLSAYLTAMSSVKYTKTILSYTTHIKNVLGNIGFILMNGNISPKDWKDAAKVVLEGNGFTKKGKRWKLENSKKFRKKYAEYQRLGVVSQSTGIGEIRQLINQSDIDNFLFEKEGANKLQRAANKVKRTFRGIENAYQAEDDFFKVVAFENELRKRSKAFYDKPASELTEDQYADLSRETADIIRDTYPTYDMVPDVVNVIRKFPVLGTFVSFEAESIRVLKNAVSIASKEITSSDPDVRKLGAERLGGILSYILLKYGVVTGFMFLNGVDSEDDEDARFFVPPWMKNGDLIYLNKSDGKLRVMDLSSSDPFGSTNSAINVLQDFASDVAEDPSNAKNTASALAEAFSEQFSTFIAEDILTAKVRQFVSNSDAFGRQVYNPEESASEIAKDVASHFYDALEPGALKSFKRYFDPEKKLETELIASFLGLRVYDVDVAEQFSYESRDYSDRLLNAGQGYRSATYKETATEEDLKEEYNESNQAVKNLLEEMSERYQAAIRLGADKKELKKALDDSRMKSSYKKQIISGKILDEQDLGGKNKKKGGGTTWSGVNEFKPSN